MQLRRLLLRKEPASLPEAYEGLPVWIPSNAHRQDISSCFPDPIWKGGRLHPFPDQVRSKYDMPD